MGFFTRSSGEIQRSIENVQKSIEERRKALDLQKKSLEIDRFNHNNRMDAFRGKHVINKKPDKLSIEQEKVFWERQQKHYKIQFDQIRRDISNYQSQLESLKKDLADAKEREKLEKQKEKEEEKLRTAAQKEKDREEKALEKERERQRIAREKVEEAERKMKEEEEARIAAAPVTEKEIDDNFLRVCKYAIRSGAIGSSMLVSEFGFRPKLAAAMINKLEKEGVIYQETNNGKYDCLVSNEDNLPDILKESIEDKASRISSSREVLRRKKELEARERARIAEEHRAKAEAERIAREAERQAREAERRAKEEEKARLEAEKRKRAKARRKWIVLACIFIYIILFLLPFANSYFSDRSSIKQALADKEYAKAGELMIQSSYAVNESMAIDFFSNAANYDDAIKLIPAVAEALSSSSKYEKTYRIAVSSLCEKGLYQEAIDCLNIPFNPVAEEELAVDYRNILEQVLKVKNRKMRKVVLDSAAEVCPGNMSTVVEPLLKDYLDQKRYRDCVILLLDSKAPDLLERLVDQMVQDGKKSEAKRILASNEAAIQEIKSIEFYQSLLEKLN